MDMEKIEKAKKGDAQSFYELITERRELLYKTAYLYVKNEQDALDIVGETVYHAFRSIGKLKHAEYFTTWLVKILINQALLMKKKSRSGWPLLTERDIADAEAGLAVEDKLDLLEAVDRLNEPYKTVIILKYLHDLPNSQIAEILETPVGTVKTHLHRALKKLKAYIGGRPNHEF
jgi:RNA polymerase sigma-70 factor (ECF subfamily)